jgi:hypothetical protein
LKTDASWTTDLAEAFLGLMRRTWMDEAACRPGVRPASVRRDDFFSSEQSSYVARAKRVCETCPVRVACLLDAFASGETDGVRGGFHLLTRKEREAGGEWLKSLGFNVPERTYATVNEILSSITRKQDDEPADPRRIYRPLPGETTHTCYRCQETLSIRAWGGNVRKRSDWCAPCRSERRRARNALASK